jgi:hypothetical protein
MHCLFVRVAILQQHRLWRQKKFGRVVSTYLLYYNKPEDNCYHTNEVCAEDSKIIIDSKEDGQINVERTKKYPRHTRQALTHIEMFKMKTTDIFQALLVNIFKWSWESTVYARPKRTGTMWRFAILQFTTTFFKTFAF